MNPSHLGAPDYARDSPAEHHADIRQRFPSRYGEVITVYSPDGTEALSFPVPAKGVAVDTGGTVAMAVGHGGYSSGEISIFDRTGSRINSIDTEKFVPTQVCFAPDHSIWATAGEFGETAEFFLLHHYSRDGKNLGAFLPSSSFRWGLRIANNRIGAGFWARKP
jgi:hypothetical protein